MALKFSSEFNYEALASIYPMRKSEIRRQPINAKEFSDAGSEIIVVLNKSANSFIIPETLALSFQVEFTTADASDNAVLLGGAPSFFRQLVTNALISGTNIETINEYGQLYNALMNQQVTPEEKGGMWSIGYSQKNALTNFSDVVVTHASEPSKVRTFVMPILSCLTNTNKLIPAFLTDIEMRFTLDSATNIFASLVALRNPKIKLISNVNITYEMVTLEASSMSTLLSQFPQAMSLKTSGYVFGSTNLPSGSNATVDMVYPNSLSSLKEMIWTSSPADAVDKQFSGVNPNLREWSLLINNTQYPIQGVKANSLAESYSQIRKAWSALFSTSHCGSITRDNMGKSCDGDKPTKEFAEYTKTIANLTTDLTNSAKSNKWYGVLDLEVINNGAKDVLLNGISTKDSVNTLRLQIDSAITPAVTVKYWSHYDVIITFDYQNQLVSVNQ